VRWETVPRVHQRTEAVDVRRSGAHPSTQRFTDVRRDPAAHAKASIWAAHRVLAGGYD
jgi:hypothetical protein